MADYWREKVVLVTGGSAGLGRAIARAFADRGAKVVIAARGQQMLAEAQQQLRAAGHDVLAVAADVTQPDQVASLIERTVERCGRLDVLVNSVGRSTRCKVLETTPEAYRKLMEINFLSVVHCCRAAMPHLVRARGHIVNIGSLSAKTVSPYLSAYAASKFALAAYTHQLRIEGPRGVHVLLVCPGPIAREDAGGRYDDQAGHLPEQARRPGGGARLRTICPDRLARQILRACRRRQPELVVPAKARLLFAVAQLWPTVGDWILRRWTS